jgi:2-keto-4-pentenoate hydratase/2-oxohepta-3-ene-1,7-dioic acid hydratase in catechol pathway
MYGVEGRCPYATAGEGYARRPFRKGRRPGIAADDGAGWHGVTERESGFPGTLPELIAQGADLLRKGKALLHMPAIDPNSVRILPPVLKPPKILCVGPNYDDHLEESGLKKPAIWPARSC